MPAKSEKEAEEHRRLKNHMVRYKSRVKGLKRMNLDEPMHMVDGANEGE